MSLRRSKLAHQRKCELALVEACQLGDCIKVRKLLEQGVSANSVGTFGWTALHEAANGGHTAIVCLLRSFDCELDFVGTAGETALHKCAANNDVKTMDVLLSSGCGVDVRNSGGHSPLHVTAYHNHLEAAQLLLCYNADVLERDRWNQTPLHRAAARGCTNMVKLLLDYGSDVLLQDDQGYTPLHLAAAWGCPLTVQVLLDAASDIYAKNRNNKTATDVSQSSTGSSLLYAAACQTPKLQYLCILVIRKLLCNDPMQKIDRLPVSQLLKERIANVSLVDRVQAINTH